MDTTGDVLLQYYITAFPTTFMIDREGRVIGYASGALTKDIMKNIITQALSGRKRRIRRNHIMAVVTFTQENFDQEVLKSSDIAIVDFGDLVRTVQDVFTDY